MEKMKELYKKVAGDSALQAKFAKTMKDAGETAKEKLVAFAKEAGYDVSFEEAQEYFKALSTQKEGALSEEELDQVAGGKSSGPTISTVTMCVPISVNVDPDTLQCIRND